MIECDVPKNKIIGINDLTQTQTQANEQYFNCIIVLFLIVVFCVVVFL